MCVLAFSCVTTESKNEWEKFEGDCKFPLLNEIKTEDFSPQEEEAFRVIDDLFAWYAQESLAGRRPPSLEVFPRMDAIVARGQAAIRPLLEIVRMGNRHSIDQIWARKETSYYIMAALMLGRLKASEAVNDLILMATRPGTRESLLRAPAIKALGEIGDPRAIPVLEKAAEDHYEPVRKAAQEALQLFHINPQSLRNEG